MNLTKSLTSKFIGSWKLRSGLLIGWHLGITYVRILLCFIRCYLFTILYNQSLISCEGEVSDCNPVSKPGEQAYVFIRIAKPKKFCPNVLIKKEDDTAYIGKRIQCYFSILHSVSFAQILSN